MNRSKAPAKPKTTLVIVHGWTYSVANWQPTLKKLRAAGLSVKLLKVPGLTKPSQQVWTVTAYVDWLAEALSKLDKPVALGHSNGGRLLLHFCQRQPQHLKHLILLNSAGVPPTVTKNLYLLLVRTLAKIFGWLKRFEVMRRLVHRLLRVQDYSQAPPHMRQTLQNMLAADANLVQNLSAIQTPVSLIWGQEDKITPVSQGLFFYDNLPNVTDFYLLEGAGHAPYAHDREALVEVILKIWRRL